MDVSPWSESDQDRSISAISLLKGKHSGTNAMIFRPGKDFILSMMAEKMRGVPGTGNSE